LVLDGAFVEHQGLEPVRADRTVVTESELRGVAIDADNAPGLRLSDVVLRACDLSNVDGREGSLRRVEIYGSRLVGFGLTGGAVQDLRVVDSSLALGSFASSKLRDVVFERVNLAEASFLEAVLDAVIFIDCKLAGTDFRGVKMNGCAIRGTSLDGIIGVDCLRGVSMPWVDVLDSAASRPLLASLSSRTEVAVACASRLRPEAMLSGAGSRSDQTSERRPRRLTLEPITPAATERQDRRRVALAPDRLAAGCGSGLPNV
jgi:hypothetical protein